MHKVNRLNLPQTLAYHIYEEIRKRIIQRIFPPGHLLREQELEKEFGSSRGPIRESLRLLLQTGLVEHQPRRGFRVKEYSEKDLQDLYQLRATLEEMVIGELANKNLEKFVKDLEEYLTRMNQRFGEADLFGYFEENVSFHQRIIDFADNKPLACVLYYANEMSLPPRYLLFVRKFPNRRSLKYHEAIVKSIKKGDFKNARHLTKVHIMENLDMVKRCYIEAKEDIQPISSKIALISF
jgi:DNA-binding GntR family transcriptional regulator